jgi:hypothetical protein
LEGLWTILAETTSYGRFAGDWGGVNIEATHSIASFEVDCATTRVEVESGLCYRDLQFVGQSAEALCGILEIYRFLGKNLLYFTNGYMAEAQAASGEQATTRLAMFGYTIYEIFSTNNIL